MTEILITAAILAGLVLFFLFLLVAPKFKRRLIMAGPIVRPMAQGRVHPHIGRVLGVTGTKRVLFATELLEALVRFCDSADIAVTWDAMEKPLLECVLDADPQLRHRLAAALRAAAEATVDRATQRSMGDLARSLD